MKKYIFLPVVAAGIFILAGMASGQMEMNMGATMLSDNWRFKPVEHFTSDYLAPDYNDADWLLVRVPSQWQSYPGLERYHGRGVYRLKFDFPAQMKMMVYHLRFGGVFYKAVVYLNGQRLGSHEGYFEPFEFDVSGLLKPKANLLVVEVECLKEKRVTAKKQVLGVFGNWDVISSYRNPGGIWLPVQIVATCPAWLGKIRFTTLAVSPVPRVRIEAEVLGRSMPGLVVNFTLKPDNFNGKSFILSAKVANGKAAGEYYLEGAQLWWTHDRGFPSCYLLTVQLNGSMETMQKSMGGEGMKEMMPKKQMDRGIAVSGMAGGKSGGKSGEPILVSPVPMVSMTMDEKNLLTGIRTIEVQDQFHFFLNGQSLYLKGNNYAPSMVYLSQTTPELVAKDIKMFQAAHYNMVRVHAHIDSPFFYEAADRGGVLLFQDGPFQWGYDHSIVEQAVIQTRAYVNLLYNHPAVALWSVHNEPLASGIDLTRPNLIDAWRTLITNLHWGKPEWNHLVLDPAMAEAVKALDPSRPVNLGSGMACCDSHIYFGWYGPEVDKFAAWADDTLKKNPHELKLITEFGAQAFPNPGLTRQMLGTEEITKMPRQKMKLEYMWQESNMNRHVRRSDYRDLAAYIEATQEYQARLLKYHIERLRILKYAPNYGVICFLHNDAQPAVSWAVVDVERNPKSAYFAVADALSPIWPMTKFQFAPYKKGETIVLPLYVANDELKAYKAGLTAAIFRGEKKLFENSWPVTLEPDMKTKLIDSLVFKPEQEGEYHLKLVLDVSGLDRPIENWTILKVSAK